MDITDEYINAKELPSILLIFGEEEFLKENFFNKLLKKFINKDNEFDSEVLDGENIDLKKLVDSLNSYPFISENRIVFCKNFDLLFPTTRSKKSDEKSPFARYLLNPLNTTKLVAISNYDKLNGLNSPKNSSKKEKMMESLKYPYNVLIKSYKSVEFQKIWESDFQKYITTEFKKNGRTIEQSALELLITQTNPTIRDLNNEIEKLLVYTDQKLFISYDDVINVSGASRNYNVFELQKAIGRRDVDSSIEILINILSTDRQEVLILTILSKYFINLLKLYELSVTEKDKFKLAGSIGVSPYFLQDYLQSLQYYSIKEIENAIILITETDLKLKSTSTSGLVLLETLFVKILKKNND